MDDFDGAGPSGQSNEDDMAMASDAELLKIAWRDEKAAPEILQFKEDLVEKIMEQIAFQEEVIEDSQSDPNLEITVTLFKLDVDRIKFLLRSYLRTRLEKIERHPIALAVGESVQRLSPKEEAYLGKFCDMLESYLDRAVLSDLPKAYSALHHQYVSDGKAPDIVPKPDLDSFVFCRAKERIGNVQVDEHGDETIDLSTGDLFIVRYRPIKGFLESGQIELV